MANLHRGRCRLAFYKDIDFGVINKEVGHHGFSSEEQYAGKEYAEPA